MMKRIFALAALGMLAAARTAGLPVLQLVPDRNYYTREKIAQVLVEYRACFPCASARRR